MEYADELTGAILVLLFITASFVVAAIAADYLDRKMEEGR